MNAVPGSPAQVAADETVTPPKDSIAPLAAGAADLISAWSRLLNLELVLARRSFGWLLIGAIAVPVIGFSVWVALSALLVAVVHIYTNSWLLALLFGAGMQLLLLAILLRQMRRWFRDLTLPQSRAALVQAMECMS
jgi:hypothetical protein